MVESAAHVNSVTNIILRRWFKQPNSACKDIPADAAPAKIQKKQKKSVQYKSLFIQIYNSYPIIAYL